MNKVYSGIVMLVVLGCVCFGQSNKSKQDRGRVSVASGTSISGELQKSLDVRNAKVGDQIVLKTTQSIRQDGEVVIPKGSTLIGRVTDVARRTKDSSQSRIGMMFDRIQGNGQSIPLNVTLTSITNAATRAQVDDAFMSDVSSSSRTTANSGGGSSGGGLLGAVGSTVGSVVNTTTQTVGTVTNTAGQVLGSTTGAVNQTLSGIHISAEGSGSANSSTTLSSSNGNLRVEKGATFNFRVAN